MFFGNWNFSSRHFYITFTRTTILKINADVTSQTNTSDGKRHAAHIRRQTSCDTASESKLKLQDSHQQVYYIKSYCKTTHFFIFLNISTWLLHKRDLALGKKTYGVNNPIQKKTFSKRAC